MRHTLLRPMHISWHLAWLSAGFIAGIALSKLHPVLHDYRMLIPACLIELMVVIWHRSVLLAVLSLTAGCGLGICRGSAAVRSLEPYSSLIGAQATVTGIVSEDVNTVHDTEKRVILRNVQVNSTPLPGEIWASIISSRNILRSNEVVLSGVLKDGFGTMSATLPRAVLHSVRDPPQADPARDVRDWFALGVRSAVPEPQASLGNGYLVGQRSTLPDELDQQLKAVGLTHAVVASGYNLTILVGMARRSLLSTSKYLASLASVLMIIGFMLITGFSPSMTRAGLVTALSLAAWYYGRSIHPFVLLPFAAAITLLFNPAYVWGDLGWYLSFGSFAGLVLVSPLINNYFWSDDDSSHAVRGILVETVSATIATIPITLHAFSQLPVYSLIANMLVLPFVPLTMLLTFCAGCIGLAWPDAAPIAGLPASAVLDYMISVVGRIAAWPGALIRLEFPVGYMLVSYVLIGLALHHMWRTTGYSFKYAAIKLIGDKNETHLNIAQIGARATPPGFDDRHYDRRSTHRDRGQRSGRNHHIRDAAITTGARSVENRRLQQWHTGERLHRRPGG